MPKQERRDYMEVLGLKEDGGCPYPVPPSILAEEGGGSSKRRREEGTTPGKLSIWSKRRQVQDMRHED